MHIKLYRQLIMIFLIGICIASGFILFKDDLDVTIQETMSIETVSSSTTDWGLSFQTEGDAPVGNMSISDLNNFDAYYLGNTDEKKIYLTFDCGFENGNTEAILDGLKKHNAPATFFIVGNMIETAPEIVQRMVLDGHIVGNHTYHHPDMSQISDQAAFENELNELESKFFELTQTKMPKFYRPPQGKFSQENLKQAKTLGYKTVFWSLAYVDWYNDNQPTPTEAFDKLIPRIHNGAIVLLHTTSETNADIIDTLLTKWEDLGYSFASLEELP